MKTLAEKLAELDASHAATRAALIREYEFRDSLPCQPYLATEAKSLNQWRALYKIKFAEVQTYLDMFPDPVAVDCRRNGTVYIAPVGNTLKNYLDCLPEWVMERCYEVELRGGRGFVTNTIVFFISPTIQIELEVDDWPWNLRVRMDARYNKHGDCTSVTKDDPPALKQKCQRLVAFGGGSMDSYDRRFFFSGKESLLKALEGKQ